MEKPYILDETEDFAVVYKPPRMHSAPLKNGGGGTGIAGDTLLGWYAAQFPQVMELSGRGEGAPSREGGLLHRLDFETQGLMLFARNQMSLDYLLNLQEQGSFIKEYSAICQKTDAVLSSAPPPPCAVSALPEKGILESYFRPFGPGRKQVRPVTDNGKGKEIARDRGGYYRTEIIGVIKNKYYNLSIQLRRGFRHQIRCHLAWIGCPVLNDALYGSAGEGFLALRSHGLIFSDPHSGKPKEYRIDSWSNY